MKKIYKTIGILLVSIIILTPNITALAASKSFTFNITHHIAIGSLTSTKTSATGTVNMTNWGTDNYFTIHEYDSSGISVKLMGKMTYSKSSAGSPYSSTVYGLTKGKKYSYEMWKNQNGKRIQGSGTISY